MKPHPDLLTLPETIDKVSKELLHRFPDCHYTVQVLLWDDNTSRVLARHGDGNTINSVMWYDGQLIYESQPMLSKYATMDEKGNTFYVLYPEEAESRDAAVVTEIIHPTPF